MDENTKIALQDRIAQLIGMHKNIYLVLDEIKNMYNIDNQQIENDIDGAITILMVLDSNFKKLYTEIMGAKAEDKQ